MEGETISGKDFEIKGIRCTAIVSGKECSVVPFEGSFTLNEGTQGEKEGVIVKAIKNNVNMYDTQEGYHNSNSQVSAAHFGRGFVRARAGRGSVVGVESDFWLANLENGASIHHNSRQGIELTVPQGAFARLLSSSQQIIGEFGDVTTIWRNTLDILLLSTKVYIENRITYFLDGSPRKYMAVYALGDSNKGWKLPISQMQIYHLK